MVVLDQNDEAPQFDRAVYTKAVSEDAPGGTRVIQVSQRSHGGHMEVIQVIWGHGEDYEVGDVKDRDNEKAVLLRNGMCHFEFYFNCLLLTASEP